MRERAIGCRALGIFCEKCTKLDANGPKEMLHLNKLHILAIYAGWWI